VAANHVPHVQLRHLVVGQVDGLVAGRLELGGECGAVLT
jgi:hypothetical protein